MANTWQEAKKKVDEILNNKAQYEIAENVKHTINGMPATEYYKNKTKKVYDDLIKNGYGTLASNLQSRNYEQAKEYMNTFQNKMGRSAFRPYMYEKGKSFGLTSQDIDNLTSFDNDTGEVIFAGKNIGKPAGIVDGVSYWDSSALDNVWNNYVADSGISRSKEQLEGIANEKINSELDAYQKNVSADRDLLIKRNQEESDYTKNHNPYDSAIGKAIMDKYNYLGGIASGNEIAGGASTNGGNIDSFSAANAARQQLAFTTAGTDAVLKDFNTRLEHSRNLLKDLGVDLKDTRADMLSGINTRQSEGQRLFENKEAEKLNAQTIENDKTTNRINEAEMKGYHIDYSDNPYLNADGTVKNENIDYNARYQKAVASGNEQEAKWLSEAGWHKINANPEKYGQWYNPDIYKTRANNLKDTFNKYATDEQIKSAENIALEGNKAQVKIAELDAETQKAIQNMKKEVDLDTLALQKYLNENGYSEAGLQKYIIDNYGLDTYNEYFGSNKKDDEDEEEVEIVAPGADYNSLIDSINDKGNYSGVDQHGLNLMQAYFEEAGEGGTPNDFVNFAVGNSKTYQVDKKQLKAVMRYLGIPDAETILEGIENANPDNWQEGVEWKLEQ